MNLADEMRAIAQSANFPQKAYDEVVTIIRNRSLEGKFSVDIYLKRNELSPIKEQLVANGFKVDVRSTANENNQVVVKWS